MCAGLDEVARFEWLWRILRHDELGKESEHGVFDALTERVPPPLVQSLIDVDDPLVEVVRLIDDRECVH